MRLARFVGPVITLVAVLAASGEAQARFKGDFNLFVGQLWLRNGDWSPVDEQPELGLMLNFGEERAPLHVAIDVFASSKSVSDGASFGTARVTGESHEFAIGVRKVWEGAPTRPHLGAGATSIWVSEELEDLSGTTTQREDRVYGAWVDLGVSWRVATHLNLGVQARYSFARATLGQGSNGRDVAAGGVHVGLLIGYGW